MYSNYVLPKLPSALLSNFRLVNSTVEALLATVKRLGVRSHILVVVGRGSQISGAFRMPQSFWASVFLLMVFECVSPADWEGGGELEDHI